MIEVAKSLNETIERYTDFKMGKSSLRALLVRNNYILQFLDYYLTSSSQFARCIKQIDAGSILQSIEANSEN
jgi:hypothetical protein